MTNEEKLIKDSKVLARVLNIRQSGLTTIAANAVSKADGVLVVPKIAWGKELEKQFPNLNTIPVSKLEDYLYHNTEPLAYYGMQSYESKSKYHAGYKPILLDNSVIGIAFAQLLDDYERLYRKHEKLRNKLKVIVDEY